jgi:hypothetical protein
VKNKLLIILLLLAFFKGLIWAFITPIFQAPDENTHFGLIQFIGETNHHPGPRNGDITSKELIAVGKIVNFNWIESHPVWQGLKSNWVQQILSLESNLKNQFTHQKNQGGQKLPRLYYWLNYPIYKLFFGQNFLIRFYALRGFSVVLGVFTVYLVYLIAKLFFANGRLALAAAFLVGFQPMASLIFSSITYDSLAILVSTLFIYFCIKFFKTKQTKFQVWALLVALVALTVKTQLIGLVLSWPLLLKKSQRKYLLFFLLGLILLARIKEYGDTLKRAYLSLPSLQIFKGLSQYLAIYAKAFLAEIFPWYWGVFGWLEKTMPLWVYRILKIITGFSFIGLLRSAKKLFSVIMAGVIFVNDFFIFTRTGTQFGVQGRYFLPAIAAHMILLVFGLTQLIPLKWHKQLAIAIIFGSFGLNLIGLYTLYQYFGWVWG